MNFVWRLPYNKAYILMQLHADKKKRKKKRPPTTPYSRPFLPFISQNNIVIGQIK
jgi:hypothetical protein